jgi:hypothetical protein
MDLTPLEIHYPELLFDRQRIYRISSSVDKKSEALNDCKLLVCYSSKIELHSATTDMLNKLIGACKVSDADVVYLNLYNNDYSFADAINEYNPEVVLIFGEISLRSNMASLFKNHIFEIGAIKLIRTDSLDDVFNNKKGEKTNLWSALKQLYKL